MRIGFGNDTMSGEAGLRDDECCSPLGRFALERSGTEWSALLPWVFRVGQQRAGLPYRADRAVSGAAVRAAAGRGRVAA